MSTSISSGERLAKFANQYSWEDIVELLVDHSHPGECAQRLDRLYRSLVDHILSDKDFQGGDADFSDAMWFLRELRDTLKKMSTKEEDTVGWALLLTTPKNL